MTSHKTVAGALNNEKKKKKSYKSCKAPVKSSPPTNQHPGEVFISKLCKLWTANSRRVPSWHRLAARLPARRRSRRRHCLRLPRLSHRRWLLWPVPPTSSRLDWQTSRRSVKHPALPRCQRPTLRQCQPGSALVCHLTRRYVVWLNWTAYLNSAADYMGHFSDISAPNLPISQW